MVTKPRVESHHYGYEWGRVERPEELTERHRQTVELVAEGLGNRAVAERLCVQPSTVKKMLSAIFDAVGIPRWTEGYNSRVLLARWYWEHAIACGQREDGGESDEWSTPPAPTT